MTKLSTIDAVEAELEKWRQKEILPKLDRAIIKALYDMGAVSIISAVNPKQLVCKIIYPDIRWGSDTMCTTFNFWVDHVVESLVRLKKKKLVAVELDPLYRNQYCWYVCYGRRNEC